MRLPCAALLIAGAVAAAPLAAQAPGVASTTLQHEKRRANWALRREYRSTYRSARASWS